MDHGLGTVTESARMAKKRTLILKPKPGERIVVESIRRVKVKLELQEGSTAYTEKVDLAARKG